MSNKVLPLITVIVLLVVQCAKAQNKSNTWSIGLRTGATNTFTTALNKNHDNLSWRDMRSEGSQFHHSIFINKEIGKKRNGY